MRAFKSINKKQKIIFKNLFKIQSYSIQAKAIRFNEWGDPRRVLK